LSPASSSISPNLLLNEATSGLDTASEQSKTTRSLRFQRTLKALGHYVPSGRRGPSARWWRCKVSDFVLHMVGCKSSKISHLHRSKNTL
jgi:hypothetical protein